MAVVEEGSLRITTERNVSVVAWRDAPTVKQLRAFEREGHALEKRFPKRCGLFNVILSGKPDFSSEVRAETNRIGALGDMYTLATAHVILVEGLVGSAVRAFLATSMLVSKPPTPTKVFGDKDLAVAWVLGRIAEAGEPWTSVQLRELLDRA